MANYIDYLSHFDFDISFKSTKVNANADFCSRLPLPPIEDTGYRISEWGKEIEWDGFDCFVKNQIKQLLDMNGTHRKWVTQEPIYEQDNPDSSWKGLTQFGYEAPGVNYMLSGTCLLLEHRVIIPPCLRSAILTDFHAAHRDYKNEELSALLFWH